MKALHVLSVLVAFACLSPVAWGQQAVSSAQTQQILQQVTSRARKTWIPAGTIQATHKEYGAPKTTDPTTIKNEQDKAVREYDNNGNKREKTAALQKMKRDAIPFNVKYKLSNEWAMTSRVTARYNNGQFYWETNIDSRQDSVRPDATLAGNYMTEQFNTTWNKRRIFAWNGQEYTTYSASGNQATVDATGKLPRAVSGPLTAGLIPWGNGRYSLASLTAAQASAKQNVGGLIDMTLAFNDGFSANLTLDSARAYAVTKATLRNPAGPVATITCSGYQLVGGNWVPTTVTIERQKSGLGSKLPTSEQWTFTSISAAVPAASSFDVTPAVNTVMEYFAPVATSSMIYVQSETADTQDLLAQRLAYAAGEGSTPQNCATAALQHVASELGKPIADDDLARLVTPSGQTSLYDLKQMAESRGLFCRAVKTDLATLRSLSGVKAILHIPGRNHFVVLNSVDDHDVWLTDLSTRKFFYRQNVNSFPLDWSEGTALLLSDRPIANPLPELGHTRLTATIGASGWSCNSLIQGEDVSYCSGFLTSCESSVVYYYERWGCGQAPSGSCTESWMTGSAESPCDWIPGEDCRTTGEWYYSDVYACG